MYSRYLLTNVRKMKTVDSSYLAYTAEAPFNWHGLTILPTRISNHMHNKVWHEITWAVESLNLEYWWKFHPTLHTRCNYLSLLGLELINISKTGLGVLNRFLGHHEKKTLTIIIMTSSNRNIFRVTGPLCGEFTGPGEFPTQSPVTRSFDVFFDLCLNKRLSKQSGWWFEIMTS